MSTPIDIVFGASCPANYATLDAEKHIDISYKTFSESTFAPRLDEDCPIDGYVLINIPDDVIGVYNGMLNGNEIVLCDNGYLPNSGSCVSYSNDDCPTNYNDLALNDNTMTTLTNGVCPNGYKTFSIDQQCDENSDDAICGLMCENGLNYTDIGTCVELCPNEHKTLRTSTGLIYPMYATKSIIPSINLKIDDDICYVNLMPGETTGAIHIKFNNQI